MTVDFQRNAHPVERPRSIARNLATVFHSLQNFWRGQKRLTRANEVVGESAPQFLGSGRSVLLVDKIRKSEQVGFRIIKSDIEVPRIHQLVHNAMDSGKELLEIVRAAALFGDAVERGAQCLDSPAIGNIMIAGVKACHLSIQKKRGARHGDIKQRAIFFSALSFQGDALALGERLGNPLRLGQPVRRHDQIFQGLPDYFGRFVFKHAHERFVREEHAVG